MDLIDRLAEHTTVGSAPREELAWLVAQSALRQLAPGEALSRTGIPVEGLFIMLSGRVVLFVNRGGGPHKAMEWRAGDVTGVLPYSRLTGPPGDVFAEEPTDILALHRDRLPDMIGACPELTSILVHKMLDRARVFTSNDLHDEKMVSLGKLSAGLAHELNNPAAAIERSASILEDRLEEAERAARALGAASLTETQLSALDHLRESCLSSRASGVLSPIERSEREDAMADWLTSHGVGVGIAEPLADSAVTFSALDTIARAVPGPPLEAALRWAAAGCSVRGLTSEIQEAAMRIAGLVAAVKGFTHMDQAMVAEPVDLTRSLGNTVAVLRSKAQGKSVAVTVTIEPGLPAVRGFVGELNQIWANLIDNALDAVPDGGRVEIAAVRDRSRVVVKISDNGTGIAPDVRDRMFDPFFTTKPVGKGTGLGLDIVRRLLTHNEAQIEVDSRPGRTEFRVSMPVAENEAEAGRP